MDTITLDTSSWTRLDEVEEYAEAHGMAVEEAIMHLVNSGLSHWRR